MAAAEGEDAQRTDALLAGTQPKPSVLVDLYDPLEIAANEPQSF